MKIRDLCHRPHVVEIGVRDARLVPRVNRHHAESSSLAHALSHHVVIAGLEDAQRQRSVRNSTMLSGNSAIAVMLRAALACRPRLHVVPRSQRGEQLPMQSAEAAVAHHQDLIARESSRRQRLDQGLDAVGEMRPCANGASAAGKSQPSSGAFRNQTASAAASDGAS